MARLDPHPDRPPRRVDIPRHDMVRWLSPITLARAGLEIGVSWVFGTFADKREIQAGLPAPRASYADDAEPDGSFWIDFVSDAGDGFDAAYTVAWLLAQPGLVLSHDGAGHATRRGRLLIHGGDQVYPAAGWERYQERFVLPYRAALPFVRDEARAPHLFAVPGNHDWYDGLTSFMRLFCQERWIGGWRTRQSRSYFALRLPHDWWLWAIDVQLDTYIDEPQLDFFEQVACDAFEHGGKVILVTSKPSWVRAGERPVPRSWETLAFFEEKVIRRRGGEVALTLAGDIHHYCHYRGPGSARPVHRVTSGAGGASLSSTHAMHPTLELTGHGADSPERFERVATFPEVGESERLARGVLRLLNPLYGPSQGVLIGAIYALFALVLANGVKDRDGSVLQSFDGRGPLALLCDALTSWFALLAALLAALLIVDADVRADSPRARVCKRLRYGLAHWLAHLVSLTAATLLALWALAGWGIAEEGFRAGYLAALVLFAFGWLWGRSVLALYWYWANRRDARQHATQVFAAQAIEDYKGFLRLRIDSDGRLTVFPVGVRRAVKDWRPKPPTDDEEELLEPWFEPASGHEPQPELIEEPFTTE